MSAIYEYGKRKEQKGIEKGRKEGKKEIIHKLYESGMTLKGVKAQLVKNRSKKYEAVPLIDELLSVRASLEEIRKELNNFKDTQ